MIISDSSLLALCGFLPNRSGADKARILIAPLIGPSLFPSLSLCLVFLFLSPQVPITETGKGNFKHVQTAHPILLPKPPPPTRTSLPDGSSPTWTLSLVSVDVQIH